MYRKTTVVICAICGAALTAEGFAVHVDSCQWDVKCRSGTPSQQDRHPHIELGSIITSSGQADAQIESVAPPPPVNATLGVQGADAVAAFTATSTAS